MILSALIEKSMFVESGESMFEKMNVKGIDGRARPGVACVALFDTTRRKLRHSQVLDWCMAFVCWWSDWSDKFRQWTRPLLAEQCVKPLSGTSFVITNIFTLTLACPRNN